MPSTYKAPEYPYVKPPELAAGGVARTQVAIVGAGPIGLAAAIDLALHGIDFILVDDNNTVSVGSRAICYAKRALEILDRLGCGDADLRARHRVEGRQGLLPRRTRVPVRPAARARPQAPGVREPAAVPPRGVPGGAPARSSATACAGRTRRSASCRATTASRVDVETPDGRYAIEADYVIAADGARSALRDLMGLEWKGQVFRDRFLIADVHMKGEFPTERWFWFDPPFHPGQSVLLHRQADDVWRIDFQLGWDADPEEEKKPERVIPRIRAMLGDDRPFELEWVSVYTFQCRRLDRFVHGRVLFAGDAAHQVSPFGARGANSGFQDADNLVWKLARVLRGESPATLLESYDSERVEAADENLLNSTRATDFITPKSAVSRTFRDAVLALSRAASVRAPAGQQRAPVDADDAPREPAVDARSRCASPARWCPARRPRTRRCRSTATRAGCSITSADASTCCCSTPTTTRRRRWPPDSATPCASFASRRRARCRDS